MVHYNQWLLFKCMGYLHQGRRMLCLKPVSLYFKILKSYRVFSDHSESESEVAQLCQILCDPMNCSPPGSSVHGILQARILEWIAISFSRGSSRPKDWTQVSCIAGRCFNLWATREVGWNYILIMTYLRQTHIFRNYTFINNSSIQEETMKKIKNISN